MSCPTSMLASIVRPLLLAMLMFVPLTPPDAHAAPEGRPCKNEPTDDIIQYGDLITCAITPVGDSDTFRFAGLPNERIIIQTARASGTSLAPCFEFFGPDGRRITSVCQGSVNRLDATLTQAGIYTILVADSNNDSTGNYNLALERLFPLTRFGNAIKYGQTLGSLAIDPVGDVDLILLSGTTGDAIRIQSARSSGTSLAPCLELYGPDGQLIKTDCQGSTNRIDITLTQSGTHTLLVKDSNNDSTGSYTLTLQCILGSCTDAVPTSLAAAVLPSSRSVQVGTPATAFATIINAGSTTAADARAASTNSIDALSCGITQLTTGVPTEFTFQATDSNNVPIGTPNTPVNILPGANQSFVISLRPIAGFCPTDISFGFSCSNANQTPTIVGVNTLLVTASPTPAPDIVALAATINNDGYVNIPGVAGTGVFAVATSNVGAAGTITASAEATGASVPVVLAICETDRTTGACKAPAGANVTRTISPNETPTFAVFVQSSAAVPDDPARNRVFVRFTENVTCANNTTVTRGSTSVAVRTQ